MKPDERRVVGLKENDQRIDRYLTLEFPAWSRTRIQKLINKRHVLVDSHPVSPNHRLQRGQTISIFWPKRSERIVSVPAELPFPILYEDETMLVVDKPPNLVVHPSAGHRDGNTLVEMVAPRLAAGAWSDPGEPGRSKGSDEMFRPGMVHRLDRDTSGVMVLAKTPTAHAHLAKQFAKRQIKKTYIGLVKGRVATPEGTIECYMARHPEKRQRFAVTGKGGRWAMTKFNRLEALGEEATLLELHPLTGRTHQIRVQLASFQHPILGDHIYGGGLEPKFKFIKRQMLHAFKLALFHPETGKEMEFKADVPDDINEALKLIRLML